MDTTQWQAFQTLDGDLHIIPIEDWVMHEENDCVCSPSMALSKIAEREIIYFSHSALDGRNK